MADAHERRPEDMPSEKHTNAVMRSIYGRRTTRSYRPDPVPDEVLLELINAGIHAPTAKNQQLWRFAVVTDRATIDRYADLAKRLSLENLPKIASTPGLTAEQVSLMERAIRSPMGVFYHAPALIFIFARPAPFVEQDCGGAAQNMMLAAHSLGLGSCWIGTAAMFLGSDERTLEELKVPKDHRLVATIVFGYPTDEVRTAPARNRDVIISWI